MTVANKPGHRGEHEGSRKTIARGMPGRSGVTVVTTLVCFLHFAREAAGRIWRPASLRPRISESGTFLAKLARKRAARSRKCILRKCGGLTSPRLRERSETKRSEDSG